MFRVLVLDRWTDELHMYRSVNPIFLERRLTNVSYYGVLQALGAIFRPYLPQSGFTTSEGVMGTFTLIVILLV